MSEQFKRIPETSLPYQEITTPQEFAQALATVAPSIHTEDAYACFEQLQKPIEISLPDGFNKTVTIPNGFWDRLVQSIREISPAEYAQAIYEMAQDFNGMLQTPYYVTTPDPQRSDAWVYNDLVSKGMKKGIFVSPDSQIQFEKDVTFLIADDNALTGETLFGMHVPYIENLVSQKRVSPNTHITILARVVLDTAHIDDALDRRYKRWKEEIPHMSFVYIPSYYRAHSITEFFTPEDLEFITAAYVKYLPEMMFCKTEEDFQQIPIVFSVNSNVILPHTVPDNVTSIFTLTPFRLIRTEEYRAPYRDFDRLTKVPYT